MTINMFSEINNIHDGFHGPLAAALLIINSSPSGSWLSCYWTPHRPGGSGELNRVVQCAVLWACVRVHNALQGFTECCSRGGEVAYYDTCTKTL